jgi:hypothetical protein
MRSSTRVALALHLLVLPLLAGCAPIVALKPAADAVNPACAKVIVALPETVAELPSRETDAQATAAWGTPTGVILRCGVPVPDPTATLPCITVQGVDWLRDGTNDPNYVFTTYGRDPAVEVIFNGTDVSGLSTLTDLAIAVAKIPATRECIAPEDTTK